MSYEVKNISIAELAVVDNDYAVRVNGVGSSVCLILYEEKKGIGGVANIMLSKSCNGVECPSEKKAKYADRAVTLLVKEMKDAGCNESLIKAKVVGGANLFPNANSTTLKEIGIKTYNAVKGELGKRRIDIVAEDVGGNKGRSITFFSRNGETHIAMGDEKITI